VERGLSRPWELADMPLDLGPRDVPPFLHSRCRCAHDAVPRWPLYYLFPCGPVGISPGFPGGVGFWANPSPCRHSPDRLLRRGEAAGGYSVPDSRLSLRAGRHSSPGGWGVNPACDLTTPALLRVLLDPAQPGLAGWR